MSASDSTVFIPNGDNRQDTAVLITGTAAEYGIDQRTIRAASGGFFVNDALADILYGAQPEPEPEPEPEPTPEKKAAPEKKATKKTSGNRAVKKDSEEE